MMYKLLKDARRDEIFGVIRDNQNGTMTSFVFAPDNGDYQTFKADILADQAELQDADGMVMSAEAAKALIETLP